MHRIAALLVIALAACARPGARTSTPVSGPRAALGDITAEELRRDLFVFAADSFLGREAGTPAGIKAARFLADRLAALRLEPAGDSGYLQRVPLARQRLGAATQFAVTTPVGRTPLVVGKDVVPLLSLGPEAPLPRLSVDADLVFAGYALSSPEAGRDDLAGLDVAGKAVVFVNGAPAGVDSARRAALESPVGIGERLGRIAQRGAAAIIVLLDGASAQQFAALASETMGTSLHLGTASSTTNEARPLPMVLVGLPQKGSPLLPGGWPEDDRAQPLTQRRFSGRIVTPEAAILGYNVVAVMRGSDPALKHTYVAFGSHLDHIGVQPPVNGDSINNGADDDGSGSVAMLALARAFASAREKPRRSVLFVWHTAEEAGLLGSEYFTSHPTVPLDSVVAQLNTDMIGRNAPDSLYLVGPAAAPDRQSSVLGSIVDSVNAALPKPFAINREWDSPTHPEQIYYRSDHFNYAKRGIPVVFFTSGLHQDYHQVSDEADKIDYDKLARVARLLFRSGMAVADRDKRPVPTAIP